MLDHYDAPQDDSQPRRRWVTVAGRWFGGLLSIAIIGGVALWTYRLGQRDASAVPVIVAMEGPAKIQPEDPGGVQAAHQGLSVNAVMRGAPPSPRPDDVTLAPGPAEPTDEDIAGAMVEEDEDDSAPERVTAATMTAPRPEPEPEAAPETPAETAEAAPGAEAEAEETAEAEPEPEIGGSEYALASSPRPPRRPTDLPEPRAVTALRQAEATPSVEHEGPLPAGTALIQLGAFESPEVARSEWTRLRSQHMDLLGQKELVVQKTVSSGRTFYRLRAAGFEDLADARATCAAITARGPACISTRQK